MNIVLFGLKGVGKTTIGKILSNSLKKAFIDTDTLIEEVFFLSHNKKLPVSEIYSAVGPLGFRALEFEVVQSLQDVQQSIIAVGGGVMLTYENRVALCKNSYMFYLHVSKDVLKTRWSTNGCAPTFLDTNNFDASFDKMYEERCEIYKKVQSKCIDVSNITPEKTAQNIKHFFEHGK